MWDRTTGAPLHNAIVWSDTRTRGVVDRLVEQVGCVAGCFVFVSRTSASARVRVCCALDVSSIALLLLPSESHCPQLFWLCLTEMALCRSYGKDHFRLSCGLPINTYFR